MASATLQTQLPVGDSPVTKPCASELASSLQVIARKYLCMYQTTKSVDIDSDRLCVKLAFQFAMFLLDAHDGIAECEICEQFSE